MRVLLISYEFPPIESAQSFRWHYLSRHLARRGVDVTVLTPKFPANSNLGHDCEIRVLRTYPGLFVGTSGLIASKMERRRPAVTERRKTFEESRAEKMYRTVRNVLDKIVFPDIRTEWYPHARKAIGSLEGQKFDLVVASHEPGVDLMLGMYASRKWGVPLVIDLADPLVTPYSPAWRKSLDDMFERKACERAEGVITTSRTFSKHLIETYNIRGDRIIEIEQGFESIEPASDKCEIIENLPDDQFWLLFAGNFYRKFRNPEIFLTALKQRPAISLVHVGHTPDWLVSMFKPLGGQVRCLGRMAHSEVLALQRHAPVLLSLGNSQARQVPGKLYEYFGAARPILHIALNPGDPSKNAVSSRRRGIAVDSGLDQVVGAPDRFQAAWMDGTLDNDWDLSQEAVAEFSWDNLSGKLLRFLEARLVAEQHS
jgi:glycosyltransferase involved in cell wall biosynthesis